MFVQVICGLYDIGNIITTCRTATVTCAFSVPTAVIDWFLFGFLSSVAWMILFLAFTEKLSAFRAKMIPMLAGLVAILDTASAIHALVAPDSSRAHWYSVLDYSVWIYTAIALAIFALVLYRKWDSHKPIHDVVLESARRRLLFLESLAFKCRHIFRLHHLIALAELFTRCLPQAEVISPQC